MADKPPFELDTEGRWRLASDRQQWVLQRRPTLRSSAISARGRPLVSTRRTAWRLTKALVEGHGDCLDLQSQAGLGITVTVRFPAHRAVRISDEPPVWQAHDKEAD